MRERPALSVSEAAALSEVEGALVKSRAYCARELAAMNRLAVALIAYAVLGILAWLTISDMRIRAVPLGILALFAAKSWLRRKDVMHPDGGSEADKGES